MSPYSFPTFQWSPIPLFIFLPFNELRPFSHLQCFPTFPTFQSAPIPSFIFLLFLPLNKLKFPHSFSYLSMRPPFPQSFSYFFYLSMSSHSRIHFPIFQSSSIPPFIFLLLLPFNELPFRIHFLTFPIFQWAPLPPFIFLLFIPFNELSFLYSFSWFFYLLLSSHSPIHFPTFPTVPFNKLPSPIYFPAFPTFQWASSIPHLFSYFSYLSISSHSPIRFPTIKWVPIPPFIFLFFLPFNELLFPHFFHTFLIFHSSSVPPFSFSYFPFMISAFSYLAIVGKGGNRAKRPLELGIEIGLGLG